MITIRIRQGAADTPATDDVRQGPITPIMAARSGGAIVVDDGEEHDVLEKLRALGANRDFCAELKKLSGTIIPHA